MKKISDWFYRKFLSKKYLEWTRQAYDRGHAHGMQDFQDAKHWHEMYLKMKERQQLPDSWFIESENILSITKTGIITLGREQITEQEIKNLKSEVRAIKNMQFYKFIINTIRQEAVTWSLLTSTDLYSLAGNEKVLSGKMMIRNLDIIRSFVDKIDNYKIKL